MDNNKLVQGLEHIKIGIGFLQEAIIGHKFETGEAVVVPATSEPETSPTDAPKKSRGRPKKTDHADGVAKIVSNVTSETVATIDEQGTVTPIEDVPEKATYTPEVKPEPVASPAPVSNVTPEQLKAACIEHAAKNGKENTYKLLARFGAAKASDVVETKRTECYALLKKEL